MKYDVQKGQILEKLYDNSIHFLCTIAGTTKGTPNVQDKKNSLNRKQNGKLCFVKSQPLVVFGYSVKKAPTQHVILLAAM